MLVERIERQTDPGGDRTAQVRAIGPDMVERGCRAEADHDLVARFKGLRRDRIYRAVRAQRAIDSLAAGTSARRARSAMPNATTAAAVMIPARRTTRVRIKAFNRCSHQPRRRLRRPRSSG